MIRKLRWRVVRLTLLAVFAVLLILMGIINAVNFASKLESADAVMTLLVENGGAFPDMRPPEGGQGPGQEQTHTGGTDGQGPPAMPEGGSSEGGGFGPIDRRHGITEETPFETRYFSVTLAADGTVASCDTGHIAAVTADEAGALAQSLQKAGKTEGLTGNYKYQASETEGGTRYLFLDCTRDLNSAKGFLKTSLLVALIGFAAIAAIVILISPRMIRPIAESYEKQKEFISNAGHEIKTPLAVIGSCTEVIEMESGPTKWTEGIRSQVDRLGTLTADLISLARMDEGGRELHMEQLNFSSLVNEALSPFVLMAEQKGLTFTTSIEQGVTVNGDKKALTELVNILADNAVKYAAGPIRFSLTGKGSHAILTSENAAGGFKAGRQKQLFDRFYRGDASRGGEVKGYGIGLSMAQSIVLSHGGTIDAESKDGKSLTITARL